MELSGGARSGLMAPVDWGASWCDLVTFVPRSKMKTSAVTMAAEVVWVGDCYRILKRNIQC